MDILVYGAGVIGSIYAARLQTGRNRVSVLARGQRFEDIRRLGVVVEDILTGVRSTTKVAAIDQLDPSAHYDLALIAVRRDQLASVIPPLMANRHIPTLLFMLNNPIGSTELLRRFGNRVLLGFPGAGGTLEGHVVRYAMIAQQPTMLGEPNGSRTARAREIAEALRLSGLKTRMAHDMNGWLKAHAFFVTAISGAIYLVGGDPRRLSKDDEALRLMADGVREGFATVRALGHTVSPFALRVLFTWLPRRFALHYWRRFFAVEMAEYVFGRHARAASKEMLEVANDCRAMLEKRGVEAPALRRLYSAIDSYASDH